MSRAFLADHNAPYGVAEAVAQAFEPDDWSIGVRLESLTYFAGPLTEERDMQASIELPKAFSVRDEHEFYPIQHLMAKLNPKLTVTQVATGVHVNGGCTVFWGLVCLEGLPLAKKDVDAALREAGFDFGHNILVQTSKLGR